MDEKKNLDELLASKKQANQENKKTDENDALKQRMQKVINASKKLDNDLDEDPRKQALRQKLAKAKMEAEEDYFEEEEEEEVLDNDTDEEVSLEDEVAKKKAKYYASKNQESKTKLEELSKRLDDLENQNIEAEAKAEVEPVAESETEPETEPETVELKTVEPTKDENLSNEIVQNIVKLETKNDSSSKEKEEVKPELEEENVKEELNLVEEKADLKNTFVLRLLNGLKLSVYALGFAFLMVCIQVLFNEGFFFITNERVLAVCDLISEVILLSFGAIFGLMVGILLKNNTSKTLSLMLVGAYVTTFAKHYNYGWLLTVIVLYLSVMMIHILLHVLFKKDYYVYKIALPIASVVLVGALLILLPNSASEWLKSFDELIGKPLFFSLIFVGVALVINLVMFIISKAKAKKE